MKQATAINPSQTTGVAVNGAAILVKNASGVYYELDLEGLDALFIPGESLWVEDVVDLRNAFITRTIALGLAAITVYTDTITVPSGELWIIRSVNVTTPAVDATGIAAWNMSWPALSTKTPVGYFTADRRLGTAASGTLGAGVEVINLETGESRDSIDVFAAANVLRANGLGCQLRLVGPTVITITTTTTAAAWTAAYTYTIALEGRKVRKVTV